MPTLRDEPAADKLLAEFHAWRKRWVRAAVTGYVILLLAVGYGFYAAANDRDKHTEVNCALADLIAHVPAIPYDTETIDNFKGWVEARANLVQSAGIEEKCDPEIVATLEATSATDMKLLAQLERQAARQ